MSFLSVAEIFESIQGESSFAGMGCFFIRLAGCNLNCNYCDTAWSRDRQSGRNISVPELKSRAAESAMPLIEITGGEPLLHSNFRKLADTLATIPHKKLLVETNGSLDISVIPPQAHAIVDIKCPDSGAADSFLPDNATRLRRHDEIKFVISSRRDYEWAHNFADEYNLVQKVAAVHFSPVSDKLSPEILARWILSDGLAVRLQLQLHKLINMA